MIVCVKCGIEKEEKEFNKNKTSKNGIRPECKSCIKNYFDEYYLKNKEKLSEQKKVKYQNNPEVSKIMSREWIKNNENRFKDLMKEWRENNRDYCKEYNLEYRILNNEKIKLNQLDYRIENKDKIKQNRLKRKPLHAAYERSRKDTIVEYKLACNLRTNFLSSLKRQSVKKSKLLFQYTDIAFADYIYYFESNYPVEFLNLTEKNAYHVDHIIPCSAYDFNNLEEIRLCWNPENLRIIPAKENLLKNDRIDFDLIEKHNIWHLLPESLKNKKASA